MTNYIILEKNNIFVVMLQTNYNFLMNEYKLSILVYFIVIFHNNLINII